MLYVQTCLRIMLNTRIYVTDMLHAYSPVVVKYLSHGIAGQIIALQRFYF